MQPVLVPASREDSPFRDHCKKQGGGAEIGMLVVENSQKEGDEEKGGGRRSKDKFRVEL